MRNLRFVGDCPVTEKNATAEGSTRLVTAQSDVAQSGWHRSRMQTREEIVMREISKPFNPRGWVRPGIERFGRVIE